MAAIENIRKGLYFEEFEIGHRVISPARTITETDIVNFAGITGDWNSIHTGNSAGSGWSPSMVKRWHI